MAFNKFLENWYESTSTDINRGPFNTEKPQANPMLHEHHHKQSELKFNQLEMKPLHLLYLMAIHQGDFDTRLHKGHFASHAAFAARIHELMQMGLVKYDGHHCVTPLGASHVANLLLVQPSL